MALTPEQERLFSDQLAEMGETQVKSDLDRGKISPAYVFFASKWLSDREREAKRWRDASQAAQLELIRRASAAAERQAIATERANTRATIALVIAITAMAVTIVDIWVIY